MCSECKKLANNLSANLKPSLASQTMKILLPAWAIINTAWIHIHCLPDYRCGFVWVETETYCDFVFSTLGYTLTYLLLYLLLINPLYHSTVLISNGNIKTVYDNNNGTVQTSRLRMSMLLLHTDVTDPLHKSTAHAHK